MKTEQISEQSAGHVSDQKRDANLASNANEQLSFQIGLTIMESLILAQDERWRRA
ncbi:hypothetical protein GK047_22605 [Paenibacillus sp. SYP-B3998]|uniref:Uncharacterized protein n=1 Tax=Paenibacillus sp. SYP-B3998 TaxID=2678564 RepID=A0A6G4A4P5_9BACL|nr:hypothetical protein [Paenibacillus sp. SYP-B3998]